MPTVVVIVGLLVGITGLLMLLLGIGVISPTSLNIPGINLNVQTATPGIVVMVIGFTVALVPIVMAMWVDAKRQSGGDGDFYIRETIAQVPRPHKDNSLLRQ
jgi:hypothetical protein